MTRDLILRAVGACILGVCIGSIAGTMTQTPDPAPGVSAFQARSPIAQPAQLVGNQAGPASPERTVEDYVVMEKENHDLGTRHRVAIRVVFNNRAIGSETIKATLLRLAESLGADAVFVYAYFSGDDWRGAFTAGMLEWGKNGGGWGSTEHLPVDGKFEAGRSRYAGSREEVERSIAQDLKLSIPKTVVRKGTVNYALAQKIRRSWIKNNMSHRPSHEMRAGVELIFETVDREISDFNDREATLDYIRKDMESW